MALQAPNEASKAGISSRIWRALGILPAEESRVLWASTIFFVMLASASIGLNAADALFFVRSGVETLPWMIMWSGLVVMLVTIGHAAGLSRFGARSWPWLVTLGLAALLASQRLAIALDLAGIYPAIWLTGQVVVYIGFTMLWDIAGELCDARQAKRVFPVLTSAGIAGAVTGNALTGTLASLTGAENLLLVEALGLTLTGVVARITTRRFVDRRPAQPHIFLADLRAGFGTTVRTPLFRQLAGVGAVLSILFFLVFFPFSEVAAASFDSEEALAGFLGRFSSVATASTFLVSLLVAKRLFTKFGVIAALLIVAVVYVAGFSIWLVSFGLFTATLFRGLQWVAVNALAATAFNAVFNVLAAAERSRVRDFISAVPVQVGTVIAGGVLIVGSGLSDRGRATMSLAFAAAFLALVLPMRKAYSASLVDAVRHGLSDVFTATVPGLQKPHNDADALAALMTGLVDANAGRRRVTATIFGEIGGDAAGRVLHELLDDEDGGVRLASLESLISLDDPSLGAVALELLADSSVRVRRAAIALIEYGDDPAPLVVAALDDTDSDVRAQAARIVGGATGKTVLESMIATGEPVAMVAALRCVLEEPTLADVDPRPLASHPNMRVRAVAAEMLAGRHDSTKLLRQLVDDGSEAVRCAAANSLQQTDWAATHDLLTKGSIRARDAVLQVLAASGNDDDYLHGWAAEQIDRAAELRRIRMAMNSESPVGDVAVGYLIRVLEMRERVIERWVVTALARHDSRGVLPLVTRAAISGEGEVRSEAFEAIESLADRSLARKLVYLMELPEEESPSSRRQALEELANDPEVWLRALAAKALYEDLEVELRQTVATGDEDDAPAVPDETSSAAGRGEPRAAPTIVDAVLALQRAPIFERLDPEDLAVIAKISHTRTFQPEEPVYEKGAPGDDMIVIVSGTAFVYGDSGHGRATVAELGPGEPVGELALLRRQPRMARVVAGPLGLSALAVSGDDFLELIEEQPSLATALMGTLADRIARRVDHDRSHESSNDS